MDYNKLYSEMQDVVGKIEDEEIGVRFGSKEYDNAKKACQELTGIWGGMRDKTAGEQGKEYQMSDYELQQARKQMENASNAIDAYLAKKARETASGRKFSANTTYRIEAMRDARKRLDSQMETMDDLAAERGMERPLPTADQMEKQRNNLSAELKQSQEHVHNGSSQFNDAQAEYDKLNNLWEKTMEYKNDGELPTPGEIETLKASVERARKAADDYLVKKADVDKPTPKTQRRITAMSRVKENLDLQSRMLADWEKKLERQEPEKSYTGLAADTKYMMNQMEAANEGVVGGSREYKEVSELLKQQEEKWKEFEKKGPDYKMTSRETREMQQLNEKMEKAVDKYIQNKAGKDLSPKEQRRLRTMQKVKNHALAQKKKLAGRVKGMVKEASAATNAQLGEGAKEAAKDLREANKNVHFGSKAYSEAMKSYNRSYEKWQQYGEREAKGLVTPQEREAQKQELESSLKSIDKYLDSKKDKNLDKNPKMKKRVEAMEKARKNIETRMYRLRLAENKQKSAERSKQMAEAQARNSTLRANTKSQDALARNISRASLAAAQKMTQLGSRESMTPMDKREARTALAALVLEDRLKAPGQDVLKQYVSRNGKAYANAVKSIADSKEFRQAYPDSKLTPANCKNFAANSKVVQKVARDFNNNLIRREQAKMQKGRQRKVQTQRQMQSQQRSAVRNNDRKTG